MNSDGYNDVVVASLGMGGFTPTNGKVTLYRNDKTPADGGWGVTTVDSNAKNASNIVIADLDLNGNLDIISDYSIVKPINSGGIKWYGNRMT